MRARRAVVLALVGALALGCGDRALCKLGREHVVVATDAKVIDAVALVRAGARAIVAYSLPAGLYARLLDAEGKPIAEPVRLGDRCAGGLDALERSEAKAGAQLACLVRPEGGRTSLTRPAARTASPSPSE